MTDDTSKRITEAAEQVFAELGWRSADMRAIARRAGVAVGTIYLYFPTKQDLFREILRLGWNDMEQALKALESERELTIPGVLGKICHYHLAFLRKHRLMWLEATHNTESNLHATMRDAPGIQPDRQSTREVYETYLRLVAAIFQRVASPGSLASRDPIRTAKSFMGAANGLGLDFVDDESSSVKYLVALFLPALAESINVHQ